MKTARRAADRCPLPMPKLAARCAVLTQKRRKQHPIEPKKYIKSNQITARCEKIFIANTL